MKYIAVISIATIAGFGIGYGLSLSGWHNCISALFGWAAFGFVLVGFASTSADKYISQEAGHGVFEDEQS